MAAISRRVTDKRVLRLIGAFLKVGVLENGLVSPAEEGTPQGGPLSPLLSNIVLDELDRELERRKHRFVRYADDCNIYVRSRGAGQRVMRNVTRFLTRRLKLKVNEAKSAVARPETRKFLGFSFSLNKEPKRRIAPKVLLRCKQKIQELSCFRSSYRTLRLVHLELQSTCEKTSDIPHHSLPRSSAADVNVAVIRIPYEAMLAPFEFTVQFVEYDVR